MDEAQPAYRDDAAELLAIDEALDRLAAEDPEAAQLVRLRYFAGLSVEQAAQTVGLPRSTAYVHWAYAKGGSMAKELDYVPMPANVMAAVERLWAAQIQNAQGRPLFVPPK